MTGHEGGGGPILPDPPSAGSRRRLLLGGLAGAAVAISIATVASRLVGFARVGVFSRTVGDTCLGDAYFTANTLPNVLFEVVAGGALAGVVVPVLAGPVARGDRDESHRTASALLTWAVVLLTPVAVLGALAARPLMEFFLDPGPTCGGDVAVDVATRMFWVFLPQVLLYAMAVVLTGVLQSHHRFLGPALAPLLSSLVVISAYLLFAAVDNGHTDDLGGLALSAELVLSVGTTLGVAALALSLLVPLRRTGTVLRPTLSFPPGVAARVRGLAVAGAATLLAQQLAVLAVIRLANAEGPVGSLTVYQYAWTLYLLPYAVLAVPIATSAFPRLAARASDGDTAGYAATAAATTRAVVLVSWAGAAVLAATAEPVARVFVLGGPGEGDPGPLTDALVAFAPGLVGYGLIAHLGRALYARGRGRAAATATAAGWAAVVLADVALVLALPGDAAVAALGLGNTVGMTVAGVALLAALVRTAGRPALTGLPRSLAAGAAGAVAGFAAGWAVVAAAGDPGVGGSVVAGTAAGLVAAVVFGAVVLLLDGAELRALLSRRPTRV